MKGLIKCPAYLSESHGLKVISMTVNVCRAVIEAASRFSRFFAGQMTAAGRVPPAKVYPPNAAFCTYVAIMEVNGEGM